MKVPAASASSVTVTAISLPRTPGYFAVTVTPMDALADAAPSAARRYRRILVGPPVTSVPFIASRRKLFWGSVSE